MSYLFHICNVIFVSYLRCHICFIFAMSYLFHICNVIFVSGDRSADTRKSSPACYWKSALQRFIPHHCHNQCWVVAWANFRPYLCIFSPLGCILASFISLLPPKFYDPPKCHQKLHLPLKVNNETAFLEI